MLRISLPVAVGLDWLLRKERTTVSSCKWRVSPKRLPLAPSRGTVNIDEHKWAYRVKRVWFMICLESRQCKTFIFNHIKVKFWAFYPRETIHKKYPPHNPHHTIYCATQTTTQHTTCYSRNKPCRDHMTPPEGRTNTYAAPAFDAVPDNNQDKINLPQKIETTKSNIRIKLKEDDDKK